MKKLLAIAISAVLFAGMVGCDEPTKAGGTANKGSPPSGEPKMPTPPPPPPAPGK
jgi:hypothetical protein